MTRAFKTYQDHPSNEFTRVELTSFIDQNIVPILSKVGQKSDTEIDTKRKIKAPFMFGMIGFIVTFGLVNWALPNTLLGEIATFIAFPFLFLGIMALTLFLCRHRLIEAMLASRDNFLIRSEALTALSKQLGLDYIPIPGGLNKSTKMIANWRYCPPLLKEFADLMDDHGGFDDVAEIIRQSGLAVPRDIIIGSEENKKNIYNRQIENQQFEDGIKGQIGDIPFSALEWSEKIDDTTRHHLLIVLRLPTSLTGRVEFKNKAGRWPVLAPAIKSQPVSLISKAFTKQYKVRACDQMEARLVFDPYVIEKLTAYSETDAVCGIAFENNLVVDLEGRNRFEILDLVTGEWSKKSIQTTLDDFTELYEFAEAISRAFSVKPLSRSA